MRRLWLRNKKNIFLLRTLTCNSSPVSNLVVVLKSLIKEASVELKIVGKFFFSKQHACHLYSKEPSQGYCCFGV